jgi:hypothetical protein
MFSTVATLPQNPCPATPALDFYQGAPWLCGPDGIWRDLLYTLDTGPGTLTGTKGTCPTSFPPPGTGQWMICETPDGRMHLRDGDTQTDKVVQAQ